MATWLTSREAAAHVGSTYRAWDQFVRRHGVPCRWLGARKRFDRALLDRLLQSDGPRAALRPRRRRVRRTAEVGAAGETALQRVG